MALVDLMPFGSGSSSPRKLRNLSETLTKSSQISLISRRVEVMRGMDYKTCPKRVAPFQNDFSF